MENEGEGREEKRKRKLCREERKGETYLVGEEAEMPEEIERKKSHLEDPVLHL